MTVVCVAWAVRWGRCRPRGLCGHGPTPLPDPLFLELLTDGCGSAYSSAPLRSQPLREIPKTAGTGSYDRFLMTFWKLEPLERVSCFETLVHFQGKMGLLIQQCNQFCEAHDMFGLFCQMRDVCTQVHGSLSPPGGCYMPLAWERSSFRTLLPPACRCSGCHTRDSGRSTRSATPLCACTMTRCEAASPTLALALDCPPPPSS